MKKLYRRSISGLMALLICFTTILGGGITAFAASSSGEVAKSYSIGFPRSGDANLDYSGTWGHDELHYMNGWTSGEATWMTTLHTIGSFDGPACYCIEPGVPRLLEKTYTRYGEDYWKNYPSDCNSTIDADTIKTLLGRIMQYGYQGDLSLDWRSQNEADADKMAHMMATQVLVWETVVGERDANFNHVDPGSADAVKSVYRTSHPLYSRFSAYYDSIEASVQSHTVIPSFMSKTPNKAQTVELKWDGNQYTATLTDSNHVVSDYTFSSNLPDIVFTSNGDTLTITAKTAPAEPVTISASKNNIRKGVVVWSDGHYGPDGTMQDAVTYAATVMDPVQAFLNLKVSYGSAKIVKTSEDGKVDNLTFTVTGNGINQTVKTNSKGEIQIDNLMPGVYTVTEMDYDKYEPQESRRVTVVSGQVSTVNFNNKLKRGDLQIVKSSEDNLNEGVTFHLYGTSLSGISVDEYAVTDANGVATFEDVLISGSTPYTVEEVDTAVRYVVPEAQSAPIRWDEVTNRSFLNILKKFTVTVTKSDAETGTVQGDASLAGAVYGIYKGETLVDTYTTDKNGQFVTKEYICDNDWTVREITPSEGYLLDTTVHKVGAEPQLYTVEHNQTANDVTEQVAKGNIAIIKHTDNGETQIETPESGAEFAVYLKSAGSYEVAEDTERDYLTCDENGFAQTKDMPYGIYTVHQVSGWEGSELMPDFDVFISQNGATYRYLINNAPFNSFIKIVKQDAETGKTIPYAGAGFKIYDPDGNPVTMTFTYATPTTIDVFYTNAEGSLVTPEKLSFGKGYSIVEVQAPYGYVLDETPVYFDVTEDNSTEESGVTVVKVDKPNMAQKGTITVEKNGEVFFGVFVIGGVDESGNELPTIYQPQYEKRGLPGAVYGTWYVREIEQPAGFVLDDTIYPVTIGADGQVVEIEIVNAYIRGNIHLTKVDSEYPDNKLTGATFEVYKDSNANGKLDSGDELLGTLTEKEKGEYSMNDLFHGRYFVKEAKAPEGFVVDTGVYEVMIDTDGKTYEVENKAGVGFINDAMRGNLKIVKTSSDGKVKGFAFRITGANGYDIILETNDKGEIFIDGLRIGDYTISEVSNSASSMYVIPADKKATVKIGSTTIVEMHNVLRDTPKTGDTTNLPLLYALAGLSAVGIAVCGVIGFKKKKKEDRN
ncbi:MAG: Cys-Gln thioester bond-forming surface protein [Eubacterium sp.]|nr:Cys-Gln thioester bond-forming surface protein [Eubacterium sp.]